jgi:hypothetical protein
MAPVLDPTRRVPTMTIAKSGSFASITNCTGPLRNMAGIARKQQRSVEPWFRRGNGAGNTAIAGGMKTVGSGTRNVIGTSTTTTATATVHTTTIVSSFLVSVRSAAEFRCAPFV